MKNKKFILSFILTGITMLPLINSSAMSVNNPYNNNINNMNMMDMMNMMNMMDMMNNNMNNMNNMNMMNNSMNNINMMNNNMNMMSNSMNNMNMMNNNMNMMRSGNILKNNNNKKDINEIMTEYMEIVKMLEKFPKDLFKEYYYKTKTMLKGFCAQNKSYERLVYDLKSLEYMVQLYQEGNVRSHFNNIAEISGSDNPHNTNKAVKEMMLKGMKTLFTTIFIMTKTKDDKASDLIAKTLLNNTNGLNFGLLKGALNKLTYKLENKTAINEIIDLFMTL